MISSKFETKLFALSDVLAALIWRIKVIISVELIPLSLLSFGQLISFIGSIRFISVRFVFNSAMKWINDTIIMYDVGDSAQT